MPASEASLKAMAALLDETLDTLACLQETGVRQVRLSPTTWSALVAPLPSESVPEPVARPAAEQPPEQPAAAGSAAKSQALETLRRAVDACRACPLATGQRWRGVGSPDAPVAVVNAACMEGDAEPAVGSRLEGDAGKLFDRMFSAIGLSRADLYITSALKCPVPGKPDGRAMLACRKHLVAELRAVSPKVIVALGPVAAKVLFPNASADWIQHPGRWNVFDNRTPAMLLHHPMRIILLGEAVSRQLKADNWNALKALRDRLRG